MVHLFEKLFSELNEYPHIVSKLRLLRGSKEFKTYLSSLVSTERIDRKGFPLHIFSILYQLDKLHDEVYPIYKTVYDVWDQA
jgi:hypothetical protein